MILSTRQRLLRAATRLFADSGYQGASVRDICNLAGANPGAVSYHFGGKKQLYRAVLRLAASGLAEIGADGGDRPADAAAVIRRLARRLGEDDTTIRLLLRDLADGGAVAVEALTPPLRSAFDRLTTALGEDDAPRGSAESRRLFLGLAAPLFLLTAGWPVVSRALDLQVEERARLVAELVERTLSNSLQSDRAEPTASDPSAVV